MNSTDDDAPLRDKLRELFFQQMVPSGTRARARGGFFPLRPDAQASSYYAARAKRSMDAGDFELPAPEKLADALKELWRRQGCADLTPMAQTIAELAEALRHQEEQSDEVSPFIYVMY